MASFTQCLILFTFMLSPAIAHAAEVSADGISHLVGDGGVEGESQKTAIRKNMGKQETTGQIADGEETEEHANEFEEEDEQDQAFDSVGVPEPTVDRPGLHYHNMQYVLQICNKVCESGRKDGDKRREAIAECERDRDELCAILKQRGTIAKLNLKVDKLFNSLKGPEIQNPGGQIPGNILQEILKQVSAINTRLSAIEEKIDLRDSQQGEIPNELIDMQMVDVGTLKDAGKIMRKRGGVQPDLTKVERYSDSEGEADLPSAEDDDDEDDDENGGGDDGDQHKGGEGPSLEQDAATKEDMLLEADEGPMPRGSSRRRRSGGDQRRRHPPSTL